MPPAGGWFKVLKTFQDEYISRLQRYPHAHVVMFIDFDDDIEKRTAQFEQEIPDDLKNRVFVLGARHTPEALKNQLNQTFEEIGRSLADDCDRDDTAVWDHDQLQHNDSQRRRLVVTVKPFLF